MKVCVSRVDDYAHWLLVCVHAMGNVAFKSYLNIITTYLLVCRLADALAINAGRDEPVNHGIHARLCRSKEVGNFLDSHVFAIVGRSRVRVIYMR